MRGSWFSGAVLLLAGCGTIVIGAPPEGGAPSAPPPSAPRAPAESPAPPPAPPPASAPAPAQSPEQEMAALVNRHRAAAGCGALDWLEGAARAARAHADDMARRSYFSHVSPDGEGLVERLDREGVSLHMAAENIALDPGTPRQVLDGWLRSEGHRRNLENCRYTHHGIGERAGRWTHVFVTPAP
jgi:uncharacterized protein YkwD